MADGQLAGQRVHHIGLGEIVTHVAEPAGRVETVVGVIADDSPRLLPAVLQGMQAKRREIRRIRDADHAKDPAFFL